MKTKTCSKCGEGKAGTDGCKLASGGGLGYKFAALGIVASGMVLTPR